MLKKYLKVINMYCSVYLSSHIPHWKGDLPLTSGYIIHNTEASSISCLKSTSLYYFIKLTIALKTLFTRGLHMDIFDTPQERLKFMREHIHINQKTFCKILGISKFSLCKIERGKQSIKSDILNRLKKFDLNCSFLFGDCSMFLNNKTSIDVKNKIISHTKTGGA